MSNMKTQETLSNIAGFLWRPAIKNGFGVKNGTFPPADECLQTVFRLLFSLAVYAMIWYIGDWLDALCGFASTSLLCGASPWGAGISTAGSIYNSERQLAAQREENQKNRDFNAEQSQLGREFTEHMYDRQMEDYPELQRIAANEQFRLAQNEFNMENRYNDPSQQVARLQSAGINPNSVFGGQGQVATGSMNNTPINTPSINPLPAGSASATGQFPVAQPINFAQGMEQFGQFIKAISEAKKAGVETRQMEELFDTKMKQALQDLYGQELANQLQKVSVDIAKETKDSKVQEQLKKVVLLTSQAKLVDAQTTTEFSKQFNLEMDTLLKDIARLKIGKEKEELELRVKFLQASFDDRLLEIKSAISKNKASAAKDYAIARNENEFRENRGKILGSMVNIKKDVSRIVHSEADIKQATQQAEIEKIMEECKQAGILTEQQQQRVRQMMIDNDWRNVDHFLGALNSVVSTVTSAAGAVSYGKFVNARSQMDQFFRDHYDDATVTDRYDGDGNYLGGSQTYHK